MNEMTEGSDAPNIALPADNGNMMSVQDLNGQQVVLYFYPKDDTPGCTKEAIAFTAFLEQFADQNTAVLGVSPDTVIKHGKFKAKHDLGVTLLADEDHELANAYGVWVEKNMYGRKYMGIERSTFLIDKTGKIAKIWRKVKVAGHAEVVLQEATVLNS
ncbi:thioredoxin-dependent thiol peroxidase [Ahrensia kielensis]|uniref:thioredoxin-dependent thiol peroxidase n=1 Tax=Ahrensia kielensis TaxID=76980 RepID=UPI00037DAB04|nr:thioredoxin-dependent thiol peroxidase [Ahrensia kielensis]